MAKRLYNTPFVDLLPGSISGDATIKAAAASLDGVLRSLTLSVPNLLIYSRLLLTAGRAPSVNLLPALQRLIEARGSDGGSRVERQGAFAGFIPANMVAPQERKKDARGGLKPLSTPELELLAWQFHVDFREVAKTDAQLAEMIVQSIPWHRIKGTPASIKRALGLFGYSAQIEEGEQGKYWATYQLGLPQIADIPTVQHIVKICNEMAPVRCRLWRIYTDAFDRRPIIWSGGTRHDRWSDGWWTMHSGVPVPEAPGSEDDLIVSFGTLRSFQSERYAPHDLAASFGGTTHYGFLAPYVDRPIWSRSAWSDVFPRNHGFAMSSLFSILWADRATTGRRWRGEWDARRWLDYTGFDRKLPPWRMGQRALSRSQQVYSGGNALSDINACYSRPTAVILDAPPVWGASRWSADGNKAHLLVMDERFAHTQGMTPQAVCPDPQPPVGMAAQLSVSSPLASPERGQSARHDVGALQLATRESAPPRSAAQEFLPRLCMALAPDPAPPTAVTSYRAPLWLGAWSEPGRTWTTPHKISTQ